ncbi:MAG TPA: UvrD-helicase domain-containing protein [Nitrospirota bacterium]
MTDRNSKNTADTAKSVHLSASAGSGKTRALKDRYLALLNVLDHRGLDFDQAVAITFTDKAAAEIKERVMQGLSEGLLKKIIRGGQDLRISTIHSFCMNLLKRYPLDAGLPPDFGVLDSRDQAYKVQMAIEDALEETDRDKEIAASLRDFTVDELGATIEFLLSIRSRLKRMEIDAGGPEGLIRSIRSGMEIDTAEANIKALITGGEWRAAFRQMARLLGAQGDQFAAWRGPEHRQLAETQDVDDAFKVASALTSVYFTTEKKPRKIVKNPFKSFQAKIRQEFEKLFFSIQALLYRFKNDYERVRAGRAALGVLRLYLRAEERYQASKLREGLLDFDDLEIYAYRLLRSPESPDILYWLDRKILHVLVDEFQDTSDIQWAVLNKLTEEIFSGQGTDKRMPPTLFVVGDGKQSIYRFREANYRLMENVREKMERNLLPESRELLTLDTNFRSTPQVIETVNRVFAKLWGERYKPSEADRKGHKGGVSLIEITPPSQEGPAGVTEADVLAQEIKTIIENKALVYEQTGKGWQERPAGYGDCAVLIQSRTKLKEYEAALRKEGVPFRVVGGIGFYEEDEIQAVMNVLFFLWNKADGLALSAALKSPLFGLTDKDILDLMRADGSRIDALRRLRPGDGRLLHDWDGIAGLVPLSGLIHRIINDTGASIRFGRLNAQAIFNLDKLLDTAREFDRRGYTTLQDFVEWVKNIRRTEQREAAADMNLPGSEGAVSIMTVHKAKGLEYPVVFLPGMNQFARSLSIGPVALIEETNGMRRMALKAPGNPLYEDLWKGENGEQEELTHEHQRLLYVAMTRARDRLIMLGARANGTAPVKTNTWLAYLRKTLPLQQAPEPEAGPRVVKYSCPDWKAQDRPGRKEAGRQSAAPEQQENKVDQNRVLENISPLPRSDTPQWKRATDFIEREKEKEPEQPLFLTAPFEVSPLSRGSVLHRCLEEYTKGGGYDVEKIIPEFPDILSHGNDVRKRFFEDVGSVLKRVLSEKSLVWIFERRDGSYSELPFLLKKENALISGMIDRVVIKDDTGHVVDYKAILIENEKSLADWKEHYRPQVQLYCEAVKNIFQLKSVEGHLLFLDSARLELTTKV